MHACTIVARNYLPHARVLARSFLEHNPDSRFTTLVIDDREREVVAADEPFELVHLDQLIADPDELYLLATYYDVMELATAVKPLLLMRLAQGGVWPVVYLDPDIEVYAPLVDVVEGAAVAPIVLTPHTTVPIPRDGLRPTEAEILASGVYNLGFIAVSRGCEPFLRWWWERLQRDAVVDPVRMLFTDQRWIDFVPGMFAHTLLKDPGYNVAYWNLHGRLLEQGTDGVTVNDAPLRFFHFSGYSPFRPAILSKHQGDHPRVRLEDMPPLAALCEQYGSRLVSEGLVEAGGPGYGWGRLADGTSIDPPMRLAYQAAVRAAEASTAGRGGLPPDAFGKGSADAFLEWLRTPASGRRWKSLPRYLQALYDSREDLRLAFPETDKDAEQRYVDWAKKGSPVPDERLLQVVKPGARRSTAAPGLPAVEAVGYFRAELGVGEAGRQLVAALEAAGAPVTTTTWDETLSRQEHPFEELASGLQPQVNLLCFNADRMPLFAEVAGDSFFDQRYTIGAWAWELEEFPTDFAEAFSWVDEVWANSEFTRAAVAARTDRPVAAVPPPVTAPEVDPTISRQHVGFPEGYVFFFAFDYLSVFARKNPLGLIEAFRSAFAPGSGASLVIKTINGERDRHAERLLRSAAAEHPDVHLVEGYVSPQERTAMMALADCYVSLHRSEGFGLTMAESMALGKPVIATGYSGNLDFMDEKNSYLVPFSRQPVGPDAAPYAATATWAEPDLDAAARLMRQVFDRPEAAAGVGAHAREDIRTKHSPAARAAVVRDRLTNIAQQLGATPESSETSGATSLQLSPLDRKLKRLRFLAHVARTPEMRRAALRRRVGGVVSAGFGQSRRAIAEQEATRREVQTLRRAVDQVASSLDVLAQDDGPREARARADQALGRADTATAAAGDAHARVEQLADAVYQTKAVATHLVERVDALVARVDPLAVSMHELTDELRAAPYISDAAALRVRGLHGDTIGYTPSSGAPADYAGFEALFRGEWGFIRDRQRAYLPLLQGREPVFDAGCGRGELLSLLAEAGVSARGVDMDASMIARCVEKGLSAEQGDALEALEGVNSGSLAAVTSFQFIEHLSLTDLERFFSLAARSLGVNGVFIAETVNPHSPRALKSFWLDITHRHPIFPEAALLLANAAGFAEAHIFFPQGAGDYEQDRVQQGEYALVAYRGPSPS